MEYWTSDELKMFDLGQNRNNLSLKLLRNGMNEEKELRKGGTKWINNLY